MTEAETVAKRGRSLARKGQVGFLVVGAVLIAVLVTGVLSWRDLVIRYHVHRLRTEPAYLEAVATVGTAVGLNKLVGVDFSCGDELIFTFRPDPDAEGGFRIDFQLIHDDQ